MLEIDSVQRAIEHYADYDLVDSISDTYFQLIELATRKRQTEANLLSIRRRQLFLLEHNNFTTWLLERNQDLISFSGEEGSVLEAYLGVLAQVNEIVPAIGYDPVDNRGKV